MDEKKENSRLLRTYGIDLAEYNRMLVSQNGRCKICKGLPGKRRLHVDHDHRVAKTKIYTERLGKTLWVAYAPVSTVREIRSVFCGTKRDAIEWVKMRLKKESVRGLVCFPDNRAIRMFWDNPDRMEAAAKYLRDYQDRFKVA